LYSRIKNININQKLYSGLTITLLYGVNLTKWEGVSNDCRRFLSLA